MSEFDLKKYKIRTDLIVDSVNENIPGLDKKTRRIGNINVTDITVNSDIVELSKKKGKYITISFDDVTRITRFGKCWTKHDTSHWGELTPKFFVHKEYCPALGYDDRDIFLIELFDDDGMQRYFDKKKFHIWEEIK